jgi:hypothetical protein
VRSLKQRRRETGSLAPRVPTGRPRKIDRDQLGALVRRYPDATLVELRDRLGVECSPTAIWMVLYAMRITFKKKRCGPPSGIGLADAQDLPDVSPNSNPVGATGTGFDETISSKSILAIPEPATAGVPAIAGLLAICRLGRLM